MDVTFTNRAFVEYEEWQDECEDVLNIINAIIKNILQTSNVSKEKLIGCIHGYNIYEQEINMNHSIVYMFKNEKLIVLSCKDKYNRSDFEDKNEVVIQKSVGYVYIMKNMGYFKIGKCNKSKQRLGEYTKLPEEPEYIMIELVYDNSKVESSLHEMFKEKRLRGGKCEWFCLNKEDIECARSYVKQYVLDNN